MVLPGPKSPIMQRSCMTLTPASIDSFVTSFGIPCYVFVELGGAHDTVLIIEKVFLFFLVRAGSSTCQLAILWLAVAALERPLLVDAIVVQRGVIVRYHASSRGLATLTSTPTQQTNLRQLSRLRR